MEFKWYEGPLYEWTLNVWAYWVRNLWVTLVGGSHIWVNPSNVNITSEYWMSESGMNYFFLMIDPFLLIILSLDRMSEPCISELITCEHFWWGLYVWALNEFTLHMWALWVRIICVSLAGVNSSLVTLFSEDSMCEPCMSGPFTCENYEWGLYEWALYLWNTHIWPFLVRNLCVSLYEWTLHVWWLWVRIVSVSLVWVNPSYITIRNGGARIGCMSNYQEGTIFNKQQGN